MKRREKTQINLEVQSLNFLLALFYNFLDRLPRRMFFWTYACIFLYGSYIFACVPIFTDLVLHPLTAPNCTPVRFKQHFHMFDFGAEWNTKSVASRKNQTKKTLAKPVKKAISKSKGTNTRRWVMRRVCVCDRIGTTSKSRKGTNMFVFVFSCFSCFCSFGFSLFFCWFLPGKDFQASPQNIP